ncbi:hypothetical protein RhiirA4_452449 [Rhizophagus irregularis]|uniref:RRM domain-containing protein n=1 Tax=Rhizophagus irregularis TaxID=588596 RepID=A0A2I1FY30_9GLOM|nr:hypothetical protein RhiirA4_452449 [Rhizophagus irregularis]
MCSQHFQLLLGQEVDNLYDSLVTSSQQTNYASSYTENASSDMEIFAYPEHQSPLQQIVAQIESEVDQQMEAEPSVPVSPTTLKADAEPFTPKGKGGRKKRVSYADAVKQDSNSDTSRPSLLSPTVEKKKKKTAPVSKPSLSNTSRKALKKQHATPAPKTISTVMTGYNPEFKENIREITVYDIPSRWTQLDVLNHLKNWGQVIAIKFKSQQKYTTVTVSVDLNKAALDLWNGGAWTASLGGIPVRWFPANWDLKQRKERERFQAVLIGVPATTNIATLYPDNPAHSILTPTGCKAFKLIHDRAPAN